jgi:hypothetical protein
MPRKPKVESASAPGTSGRAALYRLLSLDSEASVRRALAENPDIGADVQATLAEDAHDEVVTALAFNPNLSPALRRNPRIVALCRAGADHSVTARTAPKVLLKPGQRAELLDHATRDAFILLALDAGSTVQARESLRARITTTVEIEGSALELFVWARVALIMNGRTEAAILATFAKSRNQAVLQALAANPNCPEPVLRSLMRKKKPVRWCIANPAWFEPPLFFEDIVERYRRGGLRALAEDESARVARLRDVLEGYTDPSDIISCRSEIMESGG